MKLMFNVCHQMCVRQDMQTAVADSTNYLMAKFTFETEDWNNTTKTAVFKNGPLVKNVILDANNECAVPAEVIDASYLYVSVFGVKDPGYRITTNFAMVQIDKSGYLEGDGAGEITPSQVEQLEGAIAEKTSPNDFKTINGQNIVGSGNLIIEGSGTEVVANPEGTATDSLTKIQIGEEILDIPSGGTNVEANPTATATAELSKIKVGNDVYEIPEGTVVEANPQGTASTDLTKLKVGTDLFNIPSGDEVVANPTLAGTEADLSGIEVNGTKFKIPSGGSAIIDDSDISTTKVFSSEKVNDLLTTESGNVLPTGMISGKAIKNWGAGTTTYNDLQDNAQYYTYPITEVEPNTEYSLYSNTGSRFTGAIVGLYNASGVAISFLSTASSLITTAETKYIRFSTKSANVTQVRKGNDEKAKSENYGARYDRYLADDTVAYKMHYIYVSTTGSNVTGDGSKGKPYASVYFANNQITDNSESNRYTILVNPGTYDMSAEISGVPTHEYEGIIAKDYVYYESVDISRPDLTTIYLDGSDGLSGADLTDENIIPKCIFHFVGNKEDSSKKLHTHVKGMTLESTNARYGLHGETAATVGQDVLHENIIVKFHGKPALTGITTSNILGYGMVCNDHIIFRNCKFVVDGDESSKRTFIAHDNNLKDANINKIGGVVTFEHCDMLGLLNHLMHTATSLASVDVPFVFRCIGCTNVGTVNMETNWGKYVETIATS